jgi:drug/metabolite transporter (DMT)-like permease
VGAAPIWAALFAGLLGRWPNRREWLGLGLGFAGLVLLNVEGGVSASPIGAAVLFVAPMCWALGTVLSPRLTLPAGMMNSAAQLLIAGALFLPLGLVRGERIHSLPGLHPTIALLYLIVCTLIAFSAYSYLLRAVSPAVATSNSYVNPIVAIALGVALAGEHVSTVDLVAAPIILTGVVLLMLGQQRR